MHHLNHVKRRGAVYIWRRRIPLYTEKTCCFVQVSLQTRKFSTAKLRAALLNFAFVNLIESVKTQQITRAEAQKYLSAVVSKELERIEQDRYSEADARTPDEWRNRYLEERARCEAMRKVAIMGPNACLFHDDLAALANDGFDSADIKRVERNICEIASIHDNKFMSETLETAKTELARSDFDTDDMRALARIRLTGQATALAQSDRRNQTTPFMDLMPEAPQLQATIAPVQAETPVREGYTDLMTALIQSFLNDMFEQSSNLAEQKKIEKARRQNAAVLKQFYDILGIEHFTKLRQQDFHYYISTLARLPKIYGRSAKDRALSVHELIERAEKPARGRRGAEPNDSKSQQHDSWSLFEICARARYPPRRRNRSR